VVNIKYPASVNNNVSRYAYLYRLQELLRLEHNKKGADFREGKITGEQWLEYEGINFDPRNSAISTEICKYRELLKKDTKNIAKLSDITL
jgi:hypothetical protein